MKKVFVILCVFVIGLTSISATGMENLYTLVVPQQFTTLSLQGGLGGTRAAEIAIDLSAPISLNANVGASGTYVYENQGMDDFLRIDANANLRVGTTVFLRPTLNADAEYKSYSLDLGGMPGFFSAGGSFNFNAMTTTGGTNFGITLQPFGGIGVGRSFSITTIRQIELIMKYLGITPTEANVRAAAEIMYGNRSHFNQYTDDNSKLWVEYYRALAQAMGAPDKVLDIIYIANSQVYAFERARYNNFRYGWEAEARLVPELWVGSGGSTFSIELLINGDYAGFTMENMLYYLLEGDFELIIDPSGAPIIAVVVDLEGSVSYLPENFRWWANAGLNFRVDTRETQIFNLSANGSVNYMLNPNFTTYAGVALNNNFANISIFAGGNYRIW